MVLSGQPRKEFPVIQPGIDPGTVRLVAQCLNHYATRGPESLLYRILKDVPSNLSDDSRTDTLLDRRDLQTILSL